MVLSFFFILARSNFDHYARGCENLNFEEKNKTKKKQEKNFGCALTRIVYKIVKKL